MCKDFSIYLEYRDDNSHKFWQITVMGDCHTVTFGRVGTVGQSKSKNFTSIEACQKDAEKLIANKRKTGYHEVDISVVKTNNTANIPENISAKLHEIIKNGDIDAVSDFIKNHKDGNITLLKKELTKARKYWADEQNLSTNANRYKWGKRGSAKQIDAIALLGLALLTPSDYNAAWADAMAVTLYEIIGKHDKGTLDETPRIAMLKSLSNKTLINAILAHDLNNNAMTYSYWHLRTLQHHGLLDFHAELFVTAFSQYDTLSPYFHLAPEKIAQAIFANPLFVSEHLPFIFDYPLDVDLLTYLNYTDDPYNGDIWNIIINGAIDNGILQRQWVLKKCATIQGNHWNIKQKKIYKELFISLNPNDDDLIAIQDELFVLLHNASKSTINFAINALKPIIYHSKFNLNEYLHFLEAIVINNELKNIIKTILYQFEKLLKNNHQLFKEIYPLLLSIMTINDLSLQEKCAKIII